MKDRVINDQNKCASGSWEPILMRVSYVLHWETETESSKAGQSDEIYGILKYDY